MTASDFISKTLRSAAFWGAVIAILNAVIDYIVPVTSDIRTFANLVVGAAFIISYIWRLKHEH